MDDIYDEKKESQSTKMSREEIMVKNKENDFKKINEKEKISHGFQNLSH